MIKNLIKAVKNPFRALSIIKDCIYIAISSKDFVAAPLNRSASDAGPYITSVKKALNSYKAFTRFKRDPRYRAVLEHVSKNHGEEYLEIIKSESPDLLDKFEKFKENDLIGGASVYKYETVGKISPSTLRYIKVASDLRNLFGEDIGDSVSEIGVGYGGQLLIADKVLKFKQYDLFDLQPVLNLASQYIESHLINSSYRIQTINQHRGDVNYDLVISNYAFSELPSKLQRIYIKKIISKSKRGYLTMNSGMNESAYQHDKLTLTELKSLLPNFEIYQEKPLTHLGNYIIVWNKLN
jgi:putative sugar O-methyltransferase